MGLVLGSVNRGFGVFNKFIVVCFRIFRNLFL